MNQNNKTNLKGFFIKLTAITFAIIVVINVTYNLIFAEKLENINKLLSLNEKENRDILKFISTHNKRPKLVIGFAAETNDLEKNTEFRIKWPRGELGSLPADSEQFMLIEHMAGQLEKIEKQMSNMMHNEVNIERLQKDVSKLQSDVEKLKDGVRKFANGNGSTH